MLGLHRHRGSMGRHGAIRTASPGGGSLHPPFEGVYRYAMPTAVIHGDLRERLDDFLTRRRGWSQAAAGRWVRTGADRSILVDLSPDGAYRVVAGRERYLTESLNGLMKLLDFWERRAG